MTDSLTASMKWCRYDDEFKEKNGFRLPAGKAFFRVVFSFCPEILPESRDISQELGTYSTSPTVTIQVFT